MLTEENVPVLYKIGGILGDQFFFSGMFGLADGEWRLLRDAGDGDRPTLKAADQTKIVQLFQIPSDRGGRYTQFRRQALYGRLFPFFEKLKQLTVPQFANHNQYFISALLQLSHEI